MYHANASVRFIRIDHFALIDRLAWQPKKIKNPNPDRSMQNTNHILLYCIILFLTLDTNCKFASRIQIKQARKWCQSK